MSVTATTVRNALRRGLAVNVAWKTGKAAVVARVGKGKVGQGSARCVAGRATVKVKFTARALRQLAGRHRVKVALQAKAGGKTMSAATTLR